MALKKKEKDELVELADMELHALLDSKRYLLFKELQNGGLADKQNVVALATDISDIALLIANKNKGE